jgi:CheY-like chemotaxis protein
MKPNRKVWLLLDDDRELLEIVSTLAEHWGKDAVLLRSGSEAMAWIQRFADGKYDGAAPELALLDIRMPPGPQGDDVAREMRRTPGLHNVAVVMMTANFYDLGQETRLLELTGADAFVRKPFPMLDEFKKILNRAINKRISLEIKAAQDSED